MELRGVRVHNLKNLDVTLPWGKLIAISGVSGSGKSSLGFDTIFAEGQRRYLEALSPQSRRFLEQLPQPDADHIDPLPPAIVVRQHARVFSRRATLSTASEISHSLELLFAKLGKIHCPNCPGTIVERETPEHVAEIVREFPEGTKFQIAIAPRDLFDEEADSTETRQEWLERGFSRAVVDHQTINLQRDDWPGDTPISSALILVDRLAAGKTSDERLLDSLETAFSVELSDCVILVETEFPGSREFSLDQKSWWRRSFSADLRCGVCGREFPEPEPRLFNPNSPYGQCETCHGLGTTQEFSLDELVANPQLSIDANAFGCFEESTLLDRYGEWLSQVKATDVPLDVPFEELTKAHRAKLTHGEDEVGLIGFKPLFASLADSRSAAVGAFLDRWQVSVPCKSCGGGRLNSDALAVRVRARNYAELSRLPLWEFQNWLCDLGDDMTADEHELAGHSLHIDMENRLMPLFQLGLEQQHLDDPLAKLSSGERQRIAMARVLAHQLVDSLFVFDEPSTGLHPRDCEAVLELLRQVQQAGNTVLLVEHEPQFLEAADVVIDLGPGAGAAGGQLVYSGPPAEIAAAEDSLTGAYLSGQKHVERPFRQAVPTSSNEALTFNEINIGPLKNFSATFPLNSLCAITGVSGSGKTLLLENVLFPAIQHALGEPLPRSVRMRYGSFEGIEGLDEVVLLDQSPITGSSRSNPVTYLGAFDEIRRLFAGTPDANKLGFQLKEFSFNAARGGRCPRCSGQGRIVVDLQFLADLDMACPDCQGTRYRPEILAVKYRGLHIAEVLNLTVSEAFPFFRMHPKIQKRLQVLKEVGLDYLPLGQATSTLSGGESQRLKLAGHLSGRNAARTLFLFDEPTAGLHPADVQTLLDCFDHLISVGHSIILAEHNQALLKQADHLVELPDPYPRQ